MFEPPPQKKKLSTFRFRDSEITQCVMCPKSQLTRDMLKCFNFYETIFQRANHLQELTSWLQKKNMKNRNILRSLSSDGSAKASSGSALQELYQQRSFSFVLLSNFIRGLCNKYLMLMSPERDPPTATNQSGNIRKFIFMLSEFG